MEALCLAAANSPPVSQPTNPLIFVGLAGIIVTLLSGFFWFARWTGKVDSDRGTFKDTLKEIRDDIKRIFEKMGSQTTSPGSPLSLTPLGQDVAKELDAYTWAKELAPQLRPEVAEKEDWEVDDFCESYVRRDIGEMANTVRAISYKRGIPTADTLSVLRVVLRDALLALR